MRKHSYRQPTLKQALMLPGRRYIPVGFQRRQIYRSEEGIKLITRTGDLNTLRAAENALRDMVDNKTNKIIESTYLDEDKNLLGWFRPEIIYFLDADKDEMPQELVYEHLLVDKNVVDVAGVLYIASVQKKIKFYITHIIEV